MGRVISTFVSTLTFPLAVQNYCIISIVHCFVAVTLSHTCIPVFEFCAYKPDITIFKQFLSDSKTPEQHLRCIEIQLSVCCRKQNKRTEI